MEPFIRPSMAEYTRNIQGRNRISQYTHRLKEGICTAKQFRIQSDNARADEDDHEDSSKDGGCLIIRGVDGKGTGRKKKQIDNAGKMRNKSISSRRWVVACWVNCAA